MTLALTALMTLALMPPAFAGEMGQKTGEKMLTLVGTINKDSRFETAEGSEYLVVGDMAEDVMIKQGEIIKITGSLRTEGDTKAIAVQDFKVLKDYEPQEELEKQNMEKVDSES